MLSNTLRVILVAATSMFVLNACNADQASSNGSGKTVATVNGNPIKESVINAIIQQRAGQGVPDSPELRKLILEELISREVVHQAAMKEGIDKKPEVQLQINMLKENIVLGAYVQEYTKSHPITDDMLKAEYDKIKTRMGDKNYHARHILVADKKEAEAIIAQLKKGANFEKLAQQKSKDTSGKNGGDLGWNTPAAYVKPFGDALQALKKGEISKEPVQTQFGWHVLKLDDVKDAPSFEEVKANLAKNLQQQQMQQMASDLRAKAKVEYAEKPAAPAAPAAAPAEKK